MHRHILLGAALALATRASQPGALEPVPAPLRDLNWGQLNFLHTTDTHGWLGGHLLEAQYSADWGDYISFSKHLRKNADDKGVDLLLVDTGDRIEGNGLFDASSPKGLFQYDIYREQDVDLICIGNHELYQAYSADRELNTTVPNFKDKYIASNLDVIDPKSGERVPLAQRYKKFTTKNQGIDIVAFGFLFDFTGNANNSFVQKAQDTVKEQWFQDAIKEKTDAFVVIGHVGLRMPEFETIFSAIRKENWDTPILFFGGHAHVRDARQFDSKSIAMASGRYFETIGWMSADGIKANAAEVPPDVTAAASSPKFTRRYMDTNRYGMYYHSGTNASSFDTEQGKRVTQMISRARKALDLDHQFGCAPKTLWMSRAKYPSEDSIFSWLEKEVLPGVVHHPKRKDKARLAILNTGGIRFDIFKGPFTRDSTYIVSPFTSNFNFIPDVPYSIAKNILTLLNGADKIFAEAGRETKFLTIPEQMFPVKQEEKPDTSSDYEHLELRSNRDDDVGLPLTEGYTTVDDIGKDGDDTVHKAVAFHNVPNCIQAELGFPTDGSAPETVDLVFLDFVQPWVVLALKFAGGTQGADDVQKYIDGTFTYRLSEWIRENWKGDC
ncbi:Ser/Thr protein phosphatase family [Cordyceps fumosorosea ARSEF 2679]|uniref:Ser/Thr protein phosphatase family n=1 Tax=Cordyceps fumosorosea (strain ARSEF 2679) TaxID=1081104 RepID=A0A168BNQ8_CORFA|nr:Ser/Thr protein phosphatase family [Cordyceps fumosorosea ARSEF 2679]OAA70351.1 Ser/Thr protein phosphatase family [Cordyceps fumosorosea ARSEF 2679]